MRICRTIGTGALRNLDPFLMLVRNMPDRATQDFQWSICSVAQDVRPVQQHGSLLLMCQHAEVDFFDP